jgi:hypothetical protein
MAKSAVGVQLTEEDLAWARSQDQWSCVVVRAIQRTLPDATRVKVNRREIAFSLDRDDTRYTFITPPEIVEKVLKPFDARKKPELLSFVLTDPIAAQPVHHRTVEERHNARQHRHNAGTRKDPNSANPMTRSYERFLSNETLS